MIISREVLAGVLPATDKDNRGYAMNCVQVEPGGRVSATNGHICLTAKQEGGFPDTDFPVIPGAPFHGSPEAAVLVPAETVRKLIGATLKKGSIPVLGCVQLSTNGTAETVTLATTDLQMPMVATIHTADMGRFPVIDRVLKNANTLDEPVRLSLSVVVLEQLIKAAKAVQQGKGTPTIEFAVPTKRPGPVDATGAVMSSVGITINGVNGVVVTGVVMPCRL